MSSKRGLKDKLGMAIYDNPRLNEKLLIMKKSFDEVNKGLQGGRKRLKKGDFKKKMKNGLTYQIWFDRSRYNYIDYEIGHGNVEVGFSCIIKQI